MTLSGDLISSDYLELQRLLHEDVLQRYGALDRFDRYRELNALLRDGESLLDYGCGKGRLAAWFAGEGASSIRRPGPPISVTNYDPVTFPKLPEPHDVVACMDVLEHVEPNYLRAVIEHLASVTRRLAFVVIPNAARTRRMADGRLAHLTVEGVYFWSGRLVGSFKRVEHIHSLADAEYEMTFLCKK